MLHISTYCPVNRIVLYTEPRVHLFWYQMWVFSFHTLCSVNLYGCCFYLFGSKSTSVVPQGGRTVLCFYYNKGTNRLCVIKMLSQIHLNKL